MCSDIIAPFKNHNAISKEAQKFLDKYHPHDTYPLPIEEIAEFHLKLDIIPIPGLHKAFNIDGFLSSNRKSISIVENFPEGEYSWFEWQAYEFAGLILVPFHHLEKRYLYHRKQIKALGVRDDEVAVDRTIELLAEDFVVSREVILRRLKRECDKLNRK